MWSVNDGAARNLVWSVFVKNTKSVVFPALTVLTIQVGLEVPLIWSFCRKFTGNLPLQDISKMTKSMVQVNLCQKLFFLHQLTHNMTTDCSLNYHEKYKRRTWAEHVLPMFCQCSALVVFMVIP
jgi:hypothetical protein